MDLEIIDQIHFQYKDEYEGFHLIGSVPLYVPIYRIDCRVKFIENVPIPFLDEFICRLIQAGVTEPEIMSELLGIDLEIINSVLAVMSCNGYIYNDGHWHLSSMGSRLFRAKKKLSEVTEGMELYFDGLYPEFRTEFLAGNAKHKLISLRRKANAEGTTCQHGLILGVQTYPNEIKSDGDNLELSRMAAELLEKQGHSVVEVNGFQIVGRDLVYHEYLLLIYSNDEIAPKYKLLAYDPCGETPGPDYRVTQFLLGLQDRKELDGRLWTNEGSLDDMRKLVIEALAAYEFGGIPRQIQEIKADEIETEKRLSSSEDLTVAEVKALRDKLAKLKAEKRALEAAFERQIRQGQRKAIRHIMNHEIRNKFMEALCEAKKELDIICPWITKRVVDEDFISRLKALLERGVKVTILYGIEAVGPDVSQRGSNDQKRKERETEELAEKLRELGKGYPIPPRIERANTHEKLLICDDRFLIIGSFNFLSYRGEPGPGFRHEGGVLIEDPEFIAQVRKAIYNR